MTVSDVKPADDHLGQAPWTARILARGSSGRRVSQPIFCGLLSLAEAPLLGLVAVLTLQWMKAPALAWGSPLSITAGLVIFLITLCLKSWSRAASFELFESRLALLPAAAGSALFVAGIAFYGDAQFYGIFLEAAALLAAVYLIRLLAIGALRLALRKGVVVRLAAIVGDNAAERERLAKVISSRQDIQIVYCGDVSESFRMLFELSRDDILDEIVCASSVDDATLARFSGLAVTVAQMKQGKEGIANTTTRRGPWSVPCKIISVSPLQGWSKVVKRSIDIVGSTLAIICLSPILLLCAIAIRLETPGNVFFVQVRSGYRNRPFGMIKFRSMYTHMADSTGSQLTSRSDFRVTKVGKVLRRTSADELPQLFNVLMGQMSLVGPRPHPVGAKAGKSLYDDLIPNFYARYQTIPGITGLAQISGHRGNTETEQHLISRFETDMRYIREWSPMLDISILCRTVFHIFEGTNAF